MIQSGTQHFIIPKRILLVAVLVSTGVFSGVVISNHLYAKRVESFLESKHKSVKNQHKQLEQEREEYRELFGKLTAQLEQDQGKGDGERDFSKEHVASFQQLATRLLEGLQSMQDLLEEKEFQLWEKEGLLEYQEERLLNTEDLELEMTSYINSMAAALLAKNKSLPEGLTDQPYFDPTQRRPPASSFSNASPRQPLNIRAGVITPATHHEEGWAP